MDTWLIQITAPLSTAAGKLGAYVPNLVAAALLVLVGFVTALLVRRWVARLMSGLERTVSRRGGHSGAAPSEPTRSATIASRILFWLIFVIFLVAAAQLVGQPLLAEWSSAIAERLPNLLAAALIVATGILLGRLVKTGMLRLGRTSQIAQGEALARLLQLLVISTALLIAVDQLGIEINVLILVLALIAGTIGIGVALAFGLGARTTVSNLIAAHYLTKDLRLGQAIRAGEFSGRIIDITQTAVVLDTAEGRVLIPAQRLQQETIVIRKEE